MARRRRTGMLSLKKERLAEIHEELRITGFTEAKWFEFGLKLGLSLQTLETIEANHRGNTSRCLMTTLDKWLSRADNVTGPLSWITLADRLRRIGEVSSAERISKLSDPASGLFQHYSVRLSVVSISEESVDLLFTEGLISNETRTQVESVGGFLLGDTLREIRTSITENHNKLRTLGDILLKSDEAKTIGQDILKECGELLPKFDDTYSTVSSPVPSLVTNNDIAVLSDTPIHKTRSLAYIFIISLFFSFIIHIFYYFSIVIFLLDLFILFITLLFYYTIFFTNASEPGSSIAPISTGPFFFSAAHKPIFNEIRGSFGILHDKIVPLISRSIPSVTEMKSFLQRSFPELSAELSKADSIEGIMNVVVKNCRVNDISVIKTIVLRFEITEAKPLISEYEDKLKTLSGSLKNFLSLNEPQHLSDSKTIQFTLGWEPDDHSLDDIRNLLEEAFKELNKRIIVRSIHRGNSITIICYAPYHLLAALLLEAQDNLTVLMKEFSLIRLTIGHYTVYDKRIRYKVMNNECLAEEIKLADGEEQELRTSLDYKEVSIFEQDKQLNIIKKRKEYIEGSIQTPESKLKVKLLTRGKLISTIFKSKKSETQYFRTSLLMKAEREEALVKYKKDIELVQKNISITSELLLMGQKTNIEKKDQCTQSLDATTAEAIYTARIDYHGIYSNDLSFSEGEQLKMYKKSDRFKWQGKSLVSGDEGDIPSSCVYSMLESLQLLEFILSVEEVSLPILQKIRNDSSSNDEKASLFLETINDDPIMISALRQDKEQHDEGGTVRVNWYSDKVYLHSPSPVQCNEVIGNINDNHKRIDLRSSSTNSTASLLSSTKLHTLNLRSLEIRYTPLTNDCIQYLCILLTNNKTIQELVIRSHSISDRGATNICQALEHNSILTSLDLYYNPLITSTSGQTLSHLLLNNSSLVVLDLRYTSLSTESILLILQSLMNNNNIRELRLDKRHKETCITYPNYHLIQDRVDWY